MLVSVYSPRRVRAFSAASTFNMLSRQEINRRRLQYLGQPVGAQCADAVPPASSLEETSTGKSNLSVVKDEVIDLCASSSDEDDEVVVDTVVPKRNPYATSSDEDESKNTKNRRPLGNAPKIRVPASTRKHNPYETSSSDEDPPKKTTKKVNKFI